MSEQYAISNISFKKRETKIKKQVNLANNPSKLFLHCTVYLHKSEIALTLRKLWDFCHETRVIHIQFNSSSFDYTYLLFS